MGAEEVAPIRNAWSDAVRWRCSRGQLKPKRPIPQPLEMVADPPVWDHRISWIGGTQSGQRVVDNGLVEMGMSCFDMAIVIDRRSRAVHREQGFRARRNTSVVTCTTLPASDFVTVVPVYGSAYVRALMQNFAGVTGYWNGSDLLSIRQSRHLPADSDCASSGGLRSRPAQGAS